jgi:ribosomal protein S27E
VSVTREHATTSARCPQCGTGVTVHHTVARRDDGVRWSTAIRCLACGLSLESDSNAGDSAARAAVLATNGSWIVRLTGLGPRPIRVLRALRDTLGLSPAVARTRLDALAQGTRVEMEALLAKFVREGAEGTCVRVEPTSGPR